VAVTADGAGTAAVETGMVPLVQGRQKTSLGQEKRSLDHCLVAPEKMKEKKTSGSKNETCLMEAGPPGCLLGGRPWRPGLPGMASASVQALRRLMEMTHDGVGVVERRDEAAACNQQHSSASSASIWELELCLGKEKAGASKAFLKFLTIESTENLSPCKYSWEGQLECQKLP
jgi:hypothetical protein